MDDGKIKITGLEEVALLLNQDQEIDIKNLDFSSWPILSIKIEGDKYHGTITPSLAKSLYDYVYHLKRAYAEIKYGTSNLQKLKKEDIALFDSVTFKISEGCSDVLTEGLGKIFDAIAQSVEDRFKNMTSNQVVGLVVFLGGLAAGCYAFDSYLESNNQLEMARINQESQSDAYRHAEKIGELVAQAKQSNPHVKDTVNSFEGHMNEGHINIVRSVDDADRIKYSGKELSKEDIQKISSGTPVASDSSSISEVVIVEQVRRIVSRQIVSVSFYSSHFGRQITIQYNMGYLGGRKEAKLQEAFWENMSKRVEVEYSAVFNEANNDFVRGTLISVGDIENYHSGTDDITDNDET